MFVSNTKPDNWLTIISEEKLWNDKVLNYGGKEFSYKFNNSGIYNVYIKERPLLKQKIIVGPIIINGTNKKVTNVIKQNVTIVNNTQNLTNRSNLIISSSPTETMTILENLSLNKSTSTRYPNMIHLYLVCYWYYTRIKRENKR